MVKILSYVARSADLFLETKQDKQHRHVAGSYTAGKYKLKQRQTSTLKRHSILLKRINVEIWRFNVEIWYCFNVEIWRCFNIEILRFNVEIWRWNVEIWRWNDVENGLFSRRWNQ